MRIRMGKWAAAPFLRFSPHDGRWLALGCAVHLHHADRVARETIGRLPVGIPRLARFAIMARMEEGPPAIIDYAVPAPRSKRRGVSIPLLLATSAIASYLSYVALGLVPSRQPFMSVMRLEVPWQTRCALQFSRMFTEGGAFVLWVVAVVLPLAWARYRPEPRPTTRAHRILWTLMALLVITLLHAFARWAVDSPFLKMVDFIGGR